MEWLGIGHTRIKHSPQVNWDQSTRSLLGCLKDPLISGLIQNISFEINWNLFSACQSLVASLIYIWIYIYIYLRSLAGTCMTEGNVHQGFSTHYPRRSSVGTCISPSRVVTDIKNQNSCLAELGSSRLRQHRCSTELETRFNHSVGVPLRVWL